MKRKIFALTMAAVMAVSLGACGGGGSTSGSSAAGYEDPEDLSELDYTFGEDTTFYSEEPVSYSLLYSDHENYPYKEDWRLWSAIEEKTNVTFDISLVSRVDL